MRRVNINNEYGKLKSVVVASGAYFDPANLAINNATIRYYAQNGDAPTKEAIVAEQHIFWDKLKELGIEVIEAELVDGARGQMFTRDLAFVIGDKFFIANMKKENRRLAIKGWKKIIEQIENDNIIEVPSNIYLEGGDVIVDGHTVYVGISERTTMDGVEFLRKTLGTNYKVVPLHLNPEFLHLDVVFTIIHSNVALLYSSGFDPESLELLRDLNKIEVTSQEQFELGTNVFVVDSNNIIVNAAHKRISEEIRKLGINTIEVEVTETAKDGGAFRCMTCPLERE